MELKSKYEIENIINQKGLNKNNFLTDNTNDYQANLILYAIEKGYNINNFKQAFSEEQLKILYTGVEKQLNIDCIANPNIDKDTMNIAIENLSNKADIFHNMSTEQLLNFKNNYIPACTINLSGFVLYYNEIDNKVKMKVQSNIGKKYSLNDIEILKTQNNQLTLNRIKETANINHNRFKSLNKEDKLKNNLKEHYIDNYISFQGYLKKNGKENTFIEVNPNTISYNNISKNIINKTIIEGIIVNIDAEKEDKNTYSLIILSQNPNKEKLLSILRFNKDINKDIYTQIKSNNINIGHSIQVEGLMDNTRFINNNIIINEKIIYPTKVQNLGNLIKMNKQLRETIDKQVTIKNINKQVKL